MVFDFWKQIACNGEFWRQFFFFLNYKCLDNNMNQKFDMYNFQSNHKFKTIYIYFISKFKNLKIISSGINVENL